jgi:hypothetical protein
VSFDGSLAPVAAAVHVPALIVINGQDHLVIPMTSIQFAKLLKTEVLELDSNCGHRAIAANRRKSAKLSTISCNNRKRGFQR